MGTIVDEPMRQVRGFRYIGDESLGTFREDIRHNADF